MTIGIDASRAEAKHKTGVERYSFELLRAMRTCIPEGVRVILYSRVPLPVELGPFDERWKNRVLGWPPKYLWTQVRLSWEMLCRPTDALFVPSAALPRMLPKRTITTIHDASFVDHPKLYSAWQRFTLPLGLWDTRRATSVIVPSRFVAEQLGRRGFRNVSVVPLGVTPLDTLRQAQGDNVMVSSSNHEERYFLVVGRVDKKKNLEVVIDAFSKLKTENLKLILAGPFDYGAQEIVAHAQKSGRIDRIEFLGAVSDAELAALYRGAIALVHPCPVEGFGLPVVEAMSAGTPVLCASEGAAAEAAGDAALAIAADNVAAWAAAFEQVCDAATREALIQKGIARANGFSWETCARETWSVIIGK